MSTHLLYEHRNNSAGWVGAIRDAQEQLKTASSKRAILLKAIVAVFTAKMNSGEPWPGSQEKTGTAA